MDRVAGVSSQSLSPAPSPSKEGGRVSIGFKNTWDSILFHLKTELS